MEDNVIHLIGREPQTGKIFGEQEIIANDAWVTDLASNPSNFFGFTLTNDPKRDYQELEKLVADPTKSLEKLEFILTQSDYTYDFGHCAFEEKNPNPNPTLGFQVIFPNSPSPISYSVALRILQQCAREGTIWFGALQQCRYSNIYRFLTHPNEKAVETAKKAYAKKLVDETHIHILLGKETHTFHGHYQMRATLHIFDEIGVQVKNQKYYISQEKPWVAVSLKDEDLSGNTSHLPPEILANQGFLKLIHEDPEKAQKLYEAALTDLFTYQGQNEDQCYYGYEDFCEEYSNDIELLLSQEKANKLAATQAKKEVERTIQELLHSILPNRDKELSQRKPSTKIHVKKFLFSKAEFQLNATVETKDYVDKISWNSPEPPIIHSTKRNR